MPKPSIEEMRATIVGIYLDEVSKEGLAEMFVQTFSEKQVRKVYKKLYGEPEND